MNGRFTWLTGGAINHGLLFAGLPLPPLGGQDGQYKQNSIGGGPSDQVHGGMRWAIPFCYGDRLLETHRLELCIYSKTASGLSISRNLVIKMKKLLYDSVDRLLYSEGAEKSDPRGISGRSCGFRAPIASFCQWVDQHRHLARPFETVCGPRGHILTENTSSADSTTPHTTRPTLLEAEYWIPADWLPYLLDLNPLDFAIQHVLQSKVQAMPHANLGSLSLSICHHH